MNKYYTLNDLAMFTGLTTRTLRNYLKIGLLDGEKIDGVWQFTEEQVDAFFKEPNVKPSISAKKNATIYDFMLDESKRTSEICTVLDLCVSDEEAEEVSAFFCNYINQHNELADFSFSYSKIHNGVRVIIKGKEEQVMQILNQYYKL